MTESVDEASMAYVLSATGTGPVATVIATGEPLLIKEVSSSSLQRRELAGKYGIGQIAFAPFEDGVVEFGTTKQSGKVWDAVPKVPVLPKAVMRRAFEELGALYVLHWAEETPGEFSVSADYEVPSSVNSRLRRRGDAVSFVSQSRALSLSTTGAGPVAVAKNSNAEQVVGFGYECGTDLADKMKRADAAREFGIKTIHFVPFDGGVLEYGVGEESALADTTLNAALKMQCEGANAAYSIYWKEAGGRATVAGSYVTAAHAAELKAKGKKLSFA